MDKQLFTCFFTWWSSSKNYLLFCSKNCPDSVWSLRSRHLLIA